MAYILEDYDLSGGNTNTTEFTPQNFSRFTVIPSSIVNSCKIELYVKGDNGSGYKAKDENGQAIEISLIGSDERGFNVAGLNAASAYLKVTPQSGETGSISVDLVQS